MAYRGTGMNAAGRVSAITNQCWRSGAADVVPSNIVTCGNVLLSAALAASVASMDTSLWSAGMGRTPKVDRRARSARAVAAGERMVAMDSAAPAAPGASVILDREEQQMTSHL